MGPRQRRNTLLAITRRACCLDANLPVELDGRSFFTNVSLSFKTGHYECLAPMTRDNRELTGESATKLTLKLEAAYCLLQPLKQSCKGCHIELQYPSISYPVDSSNITLLLSHHIQVLVDKSLTLCRAADQDIQNPAGLFTCKVNALDQRVQSGQERGNKTSWRLDIMSLSLRQGNHSGGRLHNLLSRRWPLACVSVPLCHGTTHQIPLVFL